MSSSSDQARGIRRATIERLPIYLRALDQLSGSGARTVSSDVLAGLAGHSGETVRRDLWELSVSGMRGVGYRIEDLRGRIRAEIGQDKTACLAIVGAGHIGVALANYGNLTSGGFRVAALFDNDPEKVGGRHAGVTVLPSHALTEAIIDLHVDIGVVATPAPAAQAAAEALAAGGVRGILNFAPTTLTVPKGIPVRQVDLLVELQVLQYLLPPRKD